MTKSSIWRQLPRFCIKSENSSSITSVDSIKHRTLFLMLRFTLICNIIVEALEAFCWISSGPSVHRPRYFRRCTTHSVTTLNFIWYWWVRSKAQRFCIFLCSLKCFYPNFIIRPVLVYRRDRSFIIEFACNEFTVCIWIRIDLQWRCFLPPRITLTPRWIWLNHCFKLMIGCIAD